MKIQVIDNGYLELIERWGSDERIVEAARMSTDKGFQGWQAESDWRCAECGYSMTVDHNDATRIVEHEWLQKMVMLASPDDFPYMPQRHRMSYVAGHNSDEKLLRYLYTHKHMTPFEMGGVTIEVQAPIFVFREWHRHRTQSYNELSARYTELPDLFYVPSVERMQSSAQDNLNKQGSTQGFPLDAAVAWREEIIDSYETARDLYTSMLAAGVAREVARVVIPVGQISRMRASANLRNWLAFLTLRMDPTAQWEIRQYSNTLGAILSDAFPRTWALFAETQR